MSNCQTMPAPLARTNWIQRGRAWDHRLLRVGVSDDLICVIFDFCCHIHAKSPGVPAPLPQVLASSLRSVLFRFPGNMGSGLPLRSEHAALPHKKSPSQGFPGEPSTPTAFMGNSSSPTCVTGSNKPSNGQNVLAKVFHYRKVGAPRPSPDRTPGVSAVCSSPPRLSWAWS